jgi:hypothetical protein
VTKALLALAKHALALDGTEEGVACEGTPIESRTIKVKGKAFLFLGAGAVRLKLGASLARAQAIGAKEPRVVAGAGGWVKIVVLDGALPAKLPVAAWIDESYALMAGAAKPKPKARR